jgi:hypothetical protein
MKVLPIVSVPIISFSLLVSCITTREEKQNEENPETVKNLVFYPSIEDIKVTVDEKSQDRTFIIESVPDGADVYIDSKLEGRTPLIITNFAPGTYRIRLVRQDYEKHEAFFTYERNTVTYRVTLARLAGTIDLVVEPEDAAILLGGFEIKAGKYRVPAGSYELAVRRFGYADIRREIKIRTNESTVIRLSLEKTDFAISRLTLSRNRFNPSSPGVFGSVKIGFEASGPGIGRLSIDGPTGDEVYTETLDEFETWSQSFRWNGRSAESTPLPDGDYEVRVECTSIDGKTKITENARIEISSAIETAYRTVYCGVPGTIFSPGTSRVPEGTVQFSSLFTVSSYSSENEGSVSALPNISLRYGITDDLEADGFVGIIASEAESLPFIASGAVAYRFFDTRSLPGISVGTYLRAACHAGSGIDYFTNYTGGAVGLPVDLKFGYIMFNVCPEIFVSPWEVSYTDDYASETGLFVWMYVRGSAILAFDEWTIALSTAVRSVTFDRGFAFEMPIRSALEIHYLIPATQLFASACGILDIDPSTGIECEAGIGFGFIH